VVALTRIERRLHKIDQTAAMIAMIAKTDHIERMTERGTRRSSGSYLGDMDDSLNG
jgi:hypothetical protein